MANIVSPTFVLERTVLARNRPPNSLYQRYCRSRGKFLLLPQLLSGPISVPSQHKMSADHPLTYVSKKSEYEVISYFLKNLPLMMEADPFSHVVIHQPLAQRFRPCPRNSYVNILECVRDDHLLSCRNGAEGLGGQGSWSCVGFFLFG